MTLLYLYQIGENSYKIAQQRRSLHLIQSAKSASDILRKRGAAATGGSRGPSYTNSTLYHDNDEKYLDIGETDASKHSSIKSNSHDGREDDEEDTW